MRYRCVAAESLTVKLEEMVVLGSSKESIKQGQVWQEKCVCVVNGKSIWLLYLSIWPGKYSEIEMLSAQKVYDFEPIILIIPVEIIP